MPDVGPCEPWPFQCACCQIDGASPEVTGRAVLAATEVLWAATGRRFGLCPITGLMPCPDNCEASGPWVTSGWPNPSLVGGRWFNLGCGGCATGCSCNTRSQFTLPYPVTSVTRILVAGTPLATGAYQLENYRHVVRVDGGYWPECNDGSWKVDVLAGNAVPALGLLAAAELACEMVKACTPGQQCRLPARVQSITRQGISQTFLDPQSFFEEGRIGLYTSDLFIQTFNPSGLKSRPIAMSPDGPHHRRVT
jgi:hypothetical protein